MPVSTEYEAPADPRMRPAHPGAILKDDVLPALDVTVTQAARELGISRQTLHRLLAGRIGVSPEMAVRLGCYLGNGPDLWLRMQAAYDLWHARRRLGEAVRRIPTRTARPAA
jgi:addiction module HigA family antidote